MKPTPGWTRDAVIRSVELRLGERLVQEMNYSSGELDALGVPEKLPLQVWLAKEKEGLSWQQIVFKYYPQYKSSNAVTAGISQARRDYQRVEAFRLPNEGEFFKRHMEMKIREVFNCSPEDLKRYLDSVNTRKRRK